MPLAREKCRLDPDTDMQVRWVIDGSLNTVRAGDVTWDGALKVGVMVTMDWEGVPWYGIVEEVYLDSSPEHSDCDSDDEPLSVLLDKSKEPSISRSASTIIAR